MSWVGGKNKEKRSASRHGDKFWDEERGNFGLKMMSKMGWKMGEGLGAQASGMTSYLQTKRKNDNLGIGATQSQDDETWVATQSMYNDILKKLQIGVGDNATLISNTPSAAPEPERSTAATLKSTIEKRRLYSRFTQAKDLSSYSEESLSEILGRPRSQGANGNRDSSTDGSGAGAGSSTSAEPAVDEHGRPLEQAESSSLVTVTSSVSLADYFAQRVGECLDKIKSSPDESEDRDDYSGANQKRGFSTNDQMNYYDQMMQRTHQGRGGLGGSGGRNVEADDIASYENRRRTSTSSDYYSERNSLLRKLAGGSDKKPKEWGMTTALPTAEVVNTDESATFRRAVINRPGQAKFTAYEASYQEKASGNSKTELSLVCEEETTTNSTVNRKRSSSSFSKEEKSKRVCADVKSPIRRGSLTPLSPVAREEIHTIVQKQIKKGDGIVSLTQLMKRVTKKGKIEEYKEEHLAQYLASDEVSKSVVVAFSSDSTDCDHNSKNCHHFKAVHKVFTKVSKKSGKNDGNGESDVVALPLEKLAIKLKKHLPNDVIEEVDEFGKLGPAVVSLATLARTAGDSILISFQGGGEE